MNARNTLLLIIIPGLMATAAVADIIHNDDVITTFSHCMGFDCVNGENFGFDTLRLKENSLRIHFQDTSNSGSFPSNDWRIVINDDFNGGTEYFGIQDANNGRIIARFEAGAPSNGLVLESDGDLGLGTLNPLVNIHTVDGNTPTLRLEQNGSSGFSAQTWDLAGNETNFFVRDVTNGSTLPFRIVPNSESSMVYIAGNRVGIRTSSPQSTLHVRGADATTQILVEETNGTSAARTLMKLVNRGNTKFEIEEVASGVNWGFTNSGTGFRISRQGSGEVELDLLNNGNLIIAGALTQNSDVNEKQNIVAVDPDALLARLSRLPITQWQYKDAPGENHIGPMAQDFYAAFGLGSTDTGLSTLDTSGIALVGIQALLRRNEQLESDNRQLNERVRNLEAQQSELRVMMSELLAREKDEPVLVTLSRP